MKSIIEKIEHRLKELNERKELVNKSDIYPLNKSIELTDINARIDELNKLLDENI